MRNLTLRDVVGRLCESAIRPATEPLRRSGLQHWATVVGIATLALACSSTTPRVVEVSSTKRLESVGGSDQDIFLHDRASLIHLKSEQLAPNDRRQEFFVRWTGTGVDLVKFEYRQVNVPDKLLEQTYVSTGRRWTVFEVRGDNFLEGGPISAWRVSLWQDARLLSEKKSTLW